MQNGVHYSCVCLNPHSAGLPRSSPSASGTFELRANQLPQQKLTSYDDSQSEGGAESTLSQPANGQVRERDTCRETELIPQGRFF